MQMVLREVRAQEPNPLHTEARPGEDRAIVSPQGLPAPEPFVFLHGAAAEEEIRQRIRIGHKKQVMRRFDLANGMEGPPQVPVIEVLHDAAVPHHVEGSQSLLQIHQIARDEPPGQTVPGKAVLRLLQGRRAEVQK